MNKNEEYSRKNYDKIAGSYADSFDGKTEMNVTIRSERANDYEEILRLT